MSRAELTRSETGRTMGPRSAGDGGSPLAGVAVPVASASRSDPNGRDVVMRISLEELPFDKVHAKAKCVQDE